jgi:hypothetical protein
MSRLLRKGFAYLVIYSITVPCFLISLPFAILGMIADWYSFAADRWLKDHLGARLSAAQDFAWRLGHAINGTPQR